MNWISGIFRISKVVVEINRFNNEDGKYHREAQRILDQIFLGFALSDKKQLPYNAISKTRWYMAEFLHSCRQFEQLMGKEHDESKTDCYLLAGALGAFCDMAIDDIELSDERLHLMRRPAEDFQPEHPVEKIYLTCYRMFIASLNDQVREKAIHFGERTFDAQVKSKRQFDPQLSQKEADDICREKGGLSVLFLRSLIDSNISLREEQALFELGAYIQYCNDAQDLYKDAVKNLRTFGTVRDKIHEIGNALDVQRVVAFALVRDLPFSDKRKDYFLFALYLMSLAIFAKLRQFTKLCDYRFSYATLRSLNKDEVRAALKPPKLVRYAFPKVFAYNYETVHHALPKSYIKTLTEIF